MNKVMLLLIVLLLFSGCQQLIRTAPDADIFILTQNASAINFTGLWSLDGNTSNIFYRAGNVTINNTLLFGHGAKILDNGTCLIEFSPDMINFITICNNNTIHFFSNNIEAYRINSSLNNFLIDTNVNATMTANFYSGNGGGLFNVSAPQWTEVIVGNFTNIFWDKGNVTINNTLFVVDSMIVNNITYPQNDSQAGDVMTTDGNGVLTLIPFTLSQLADYSYAENETGGSVNTPSTLVTALILPVNLSGGLYRAQMYTEIKTATNNRNVIIGISIDAVSNASLTQLTTPIGNAFQFISAFASNINISAGQHNITVQLFNVDNTLMTFRRTRLELMKVGNG